MALALDQVEDALLVGVGGDQEQDLDGARLAQAMDPGDALVEDRRVPGDVQVDEDRGALEVETRAPGVGGDEDLNGVVVAEAIHEVAAPGRNSSPWRRT